MLPFSLCLPSPSFVSPPYLTPSVPHPPSHCCLSLYFIVIPARPPHPCPSLCSCLSSSFSPSSSIIPFAPLLLLSLHFSQPPLYMCVSSFMVGKEEGWAFSRALRTKSEGPTQMGPKPRADTQRNRVCRIWGQILGAERPLGPTGLQSGAAQQWEPGMVPMDAALASCLCPPPHPVAKALKLNEMLPPPRAPCPYCHPTALIRQRGSGWPAHLTGGSCHPAVQSSLRTPQLHLPFLRLSLHLCRPSARKELGELS